MNDAGRIGFVTRGEYNNTQTYDFLDVVYYNNSSYVAKKLTVGNPPADNNEYWQALAKVPVSSVLGVKGNAESAYRTGNVNLTAANVGALAKSGDTMMGEFAPDGGIKYAGKNNYIAYPDDGYINTQNAATNNLGFLRVTLPVSWTTTMLKFTVSIYDYFTGETTDYHISGYNYKAGTKWVHCTATCVGKAGASHSNLPVCFGHDGTKCAITIGSANTSWHYPIAKVHDILLGAYDTDFSKWKTGWTISVDTSPLTMINETIDNTHVAYGSISSSCTGNAASATKATQDGNGNVIADTYTKKEWTEEPAIAPGERNVYRNGYGVVDMIIMLCNFSSELFVYNTFFIPNPYERCGDGRSGMYLYLDKEHTEYIYMRCGSSAIVFDNNTSNTLRIFTKK